MKRLDLDGSSGGSKPLIFDDSRSKVASIIKAFAVVSLSNPESRLKRLHFRLVFPW